MKQRLITSLIIVAICLPFIYFGGKLFAIGVGLLGILAFKEILDLKKSHDDIPTLMKIISLVSLLFIIYNNFELKYNFGVNYAMLLIVTILMLFPTLFYKDNKYSTKTAFYILGNIFFLGIGFNIFIITRISNIYLFLFLILVSVLNEIFAYIIGSLIGKHKLCPSISPKKSIEGSIGGLLIGTIVSVIFYGIFINDITSKLIICTIILCIMGQMGDLLFSKIKRENEIKDFSNLMPGHGGILDRVDSILIIMITYIILISLV